MFAIARAALVDLAKHNSGYKTAAKNPDKFCHGFGMFQYDIQFFNTGNADYFLNGDWKTWKSTLGKGVSELKTQLAALYGSGKPTLTARRKRLSRHRLQPRRQTPRKTWRQRNSSKATRMETGSITASISTPTCKIWLDCFEGKLR